MGWHWVNPTRIGTRIAVPGIATGTITSGKIHESEMVWDMETLRHQLGASVDDAEPDTGARESTTQNPPRLEPEAR